MSAIKYPYGKPVKLLVDLQGFPDGRLVQFDILRKFGQKEETVGKVNGVIRSGKGVGEWTPEFKKDDEGRKPLVDKVKTQVTSESYYFIAKIDDKQVKSKNFEFAYVLDVYLADTDGKPLNDASFTVTFSDGSKKKGLVKDGHVTIEDAPQGKFSIELEGYEFIFE